ncbi:MAG: hypothetical protein ACLFP1_02440, partial [Candidatus Goldiibacteriota bacterium]
MVKRIIFLTALVFIAAQAFGAAQIQNLSVSGTCYTAGQYITVSFEASAATANNWINADIVFSDDNTREYTDDAVLTSEGTYDQDLASPDSDGHTGYYVLQPSDTNFHQIDIVVKVPEGYSGSYYVFAAVRETDEVTLTSSEDLYDAVASTTMDECDPTTTVTETVTETVTQTITPTMTQTSTETVTQTATETITKTATETATETITETVTQTSTP